MTDMFCEVVWGGCIEKRRKGETKDDATQSSRCVAIEGDGDRRERQKKNENIGGRGEQACRTLFLLSTAPLHGRRRRGFVALGRKGERCRQEEERSPEKTQARGGFHARQAVVVVAGSYSRQQNNKKPSSLFSPFAHPDVALLVHQGTDLVNREPVEVREKGRKEGSSRRYKGGGERVRSAAEKKEIDRRPYSFARDVGFVVRSFAPRAVIQLTEEAHVHTHLTMVAELLLEVARGPP